MSTTRPTNFLTSGPMRAAVVGVLGATLCAAMGVSGPAAVTVEDLPPSVPASAHASPALGTALFERLPDAPGIHNLFRVETPAGRVVYSGSEPEAGGGLASLAAMGVRTVVSVDGALPDAERARALGMRYVHVPVRYSTITREQELELARALRDLPGPVFVHCHHGKHRGPSALALGLIALGEIAPREGAAFQRIAGTSPKYTGLYACVERAGPIDAAELDAWEASLPERAVVEGLAAGMAELDRIVEVLDSLGQSGWRVPEDHPDLAPASLAGQAADLFRVMRADPESAGYPADFAAVMDSSVADAMELEAALVEGDGDRATFAFERLTDSCRDCHSGHRDR